MNNRIIPLTNNKAERIVPEDDAFEPEPGSIVLTEGIHGTCWQRYFSDGRWHSTTGQTATWADLMRRRNLSLVYDAEEREARVKQPKVKHHKNMAGAR